MLPYMRVSMTAFELLLVNPLSVTDMVKAKGST
jgi:hypothetical protein